MAKDDTEIDESNVLAVLGLLTDIFIEVLLEDGFKEVFPIKLFNEELRVDRAL